MAFLEHAGPGIARLSASDPSSRYHLCPLPVRAQFLIEFLPAFLGKENSRILELDPASGTRNVVGQPTRPFSVEIHVIGSPDDERRCFQGLQPVFNGERVLVVKGREETLQVAYALLGSHERTKICVDRVVTHAIRMFVSCSQSLR